MKQYFIKNKEEPGQHEWWVCAFAQFLSVVIWAKNLMNVLDALRASTAEIIDRKIIWWLMIKHLISAKCVVLWALKLIGTIIFCNDILIWQNCQQDGCFDCSHFIKGRVLRMVCRYSSWYNRTFLSVNKKWILHHTTDTNEKSEQWDVARSIADCPQIFPVNHSEKDKTICIVILLPENRVATNMSTIGQPKSSFSSR